MFEEEKDEVEKKQKKPGPYTPNRPLPTGKGGTKLPDTDTPHIQLETAKGRKRSYRQAREYDEYGREVRDVDFTDHGRPQEHPNPHQHSYKENPTGGARSRGKEAEPVQGWNYQ